MNSARLVVLALAPLQWIVVQIALRISQLRIRTRPIRLILGITVTILIAGVWMLQVDPYRSLTGIHSDLGQDSFFFTLTLSEFFISGAILLRFALRDIAKDRQHGK